MRAETRPDGLATLDRSLFRSMRPGTSNWRARLTFFVERVRRNDLTPARRRRLIRRAVLRTLATTVVVLVALYYLLPLDHNKNVPVTPNRPGHLSC